MKLQSLSILLVTLIFASPNLGLACENHGGSYGFFSMYSDWSMHTSDPASESAASVTTNNDQSDTSKTAEKTDAQDKIKEVVVNRSFVDYTKK